jgi:hypothetical protein
VTPRWLLVGALALAFGLAFGVAYLVGADGGGTTPQTVTRGLSTPVVASDADTETIEIPALRRPAAPPAEMAPAETPPTGGEQASPSTNTPVTPVSPPSNPDGGATEDTDDL